MSLIVWGIVGGVDEFSIVNTVSADDWAAESAIKATNGLVWLIFLTISDC